MKLNPEDRLGVSTQEPVKTKVKKKKASPPPPRPPRQKKGSSLWAWLLRWGCILLIWAVFLGGLFVLWFSYDLPDISKLQQTERRPSITILAKD